MTCECGAAATRDELCDDCFEVEEQVKREAAAAGHNCRVCLPGPCTPDAHGFPGGYDEGFDAVELVPFDEFQFDTDGNAYDCEGEGE